MKKFLYLYNLIPQKFYLLLRKANGEVNYYLKLNPGLHFKPKVPSLRLAIRCSSPLPKGDIKNAGNGSD